MTVSSNPFQRTPIDLKSISAQVYDVVKDAIVQGRLTPGQKLSELHLAGQLGVSRSPLREAIRRLEAEGFVGRDHGRLIVPPLSKPELQDLYAIRGALEGLAARQAAARAAAPEVQRLHEVQQQVAERYARSERADEIIGAGTEFHTTIAAMARNPRNVTLIQNILEHVERYRIHSAFVGKEIFLDDHARVVSAIAARDEAGAEASMREHIDNALQLVIQKLGDRLTEDAATRTKDARRGRGAVLAG